MINFLKRFLRREEGAITVEWVVLTAAIIGLTVSAYTVINEGSNTMASNTDTTLSTIVVGSGVINQ